MEEKNVIHPLNTPDTRKRVRISAQHIRTSAFLVGLIAGALIVGLDPWLRFPDVPVRINWQEALLTGIMMGAYGLLLAWMLTEFWHSWNILLVAFLTVPVVTGVVAIWNEVTTTLGATSDIIIYMPLVMLIHLALVAMVFLYLEGTRRSPWPKTLAFTAIPIVIILVSFPIMGQMRWRGKDAQEVMESVNHYAGGAINAHYSIEYRGISYRDGLAPVGHTRVRTGDATLYCRVKMYPQRNEVSCQLEE